MPIALYSVALAWFAAFAASAVAQTPAPGGIVRSDIGPAEAALRAFSNALESGNRDLAIARLAPDVTIIEDGHEESYADYVGGHLAADMAHQKTVQTTLLERAVINESPVRVRIVSKLRMIGNRRDKKTDTIVSETAVLARMPDGWKVQRLEWKSAR